MIRAVSVIHSEGEVGEAVTLTYDNRFRRRMAMVADGGSEFLLDLPAAVELRDGDFLVLTDGRHIRIVAASEKLMRASGSDPKHLARVAWHVGNRHLACEIHEDHIVLAYDHVVEDMLRKIGCLVEVFEGAFNPEGGVYGQGRTHGHSH